MDRGLRAPSTGPTTLNHFRAPSASPPALGPVPPARRARCRELRHSSLGYLSPMNFERMYGPGGGVELPGLADFPAEPGSLRAELGSTPLHATEASLTPQKRREVIRPSHEPQH